MTSAADAVLLAHLAFVLFAVLPFALVPLGARFRWRWVRSRPLRLAHLAAVAFVATEALAGVACPLTVWEDLLRGGKGAVPFVPRIVRALLFYDLPLWVFTALYCVAAAFALLLWRLVPPRKRIR